MSAPIFSAKFITTSAAASAQPNEYDVSANLFDSTGNFNATNIQVGDLVFLDAFASLSAPNTIARYRIVSTTAASPSSWTGVMAFDDTGSAVDPGEFVGSDGFIARPTPNKNLVFHPSAGIQTLPQYLMDYSRNTETQTFIEDSAFVRQEFTLTSTNITNKFVDLAAVPKPVSSILVSVQGGPQQVLGVDYALLDNGSGKFVRLSWATLGLDGLLEANDKLVVFYQK